jgi:hypothetical protein
MRTKTMKLALAAALAMIVLPLTYGAATKIAQRFRVERQQEVVVQSTGEISKDDAERAAAEARQLVSEGKAEEIRPGVFRVTLSDGKVVELGGKAAGTMDHMPPELKAMLEEMEALRQAGNFEETLVREWTENDGTKVSVYKETFTLADGTIQQCKREERIRSTPDGEEKKVGITPWDPSDEPDDGARVFSDQPFGQEEAQDAIAKAKQLVREGLAEEIRPGYFRVTLPDGKTVQMSGDMANSTEDRQQ